MADVVEVVVRPNDVVEVVARPNDVVEVVARLGDTIVAVVHGPLVTIGDSPTADVYAPIAFARIAPGDAPLTLRAGLLTIDVRRVPPTKRVPHKRVEGQPAAYIGLSLFVHLALWGTSMRAYPGEEGLSLPVGYASVLPIHTSSTEAEPSIIDTSSDDAPENKDRSPRVVIAPDRGHGVGPIAEMVGHASVDIVEDAGTRRNVPMTRHENAVPRPVDGARRESTQSAGARRESARSESDAGARGEAARGEAAHGEALSREQVIIHARNAGVLGADSLRALGHIPGTGELANGFDGSAIDGAARGESSAQAFASDRRLNGGCTHEPCGGIGAGRYATLCVGETPDAPCSRGSGAGYGLAEQHVSVVPTVRMCGSPDPNATSSPCVAVVGEMDKAIIRRYIRRKLPAITGCYEKELLVDSRVTGAVDTAFLIDPNGHPRDITATGMNPEVASCIATVISTIQFPLSKGGGSTQVHYPFSFLVAGS